MPFLKIDKTVAVEHVRVIRIELQGFVAIRQRQIELAHDRARPAAVVEGGGLVLAKRDEPGMVRD